MKTLAEVKREATLAAIAECHGDHIAAAKALGIGKTTIYRKTAEWGIERAPTKNPAGRQTKKPQLLLIPSTRQEEQAANLRCPRCGAKLLMPRAP